VGITGGLLGVCRERFLHFEAVMLFLQPKWGKWGLLEVPLIDIPIVVYFDVIIW